MKETTTEILQNSYKNRVVEWINDFVNTVLIEELELAGQIVVKSLFMLLIFMVMYVIFRKLFLPIIKLFIKKTRTGWDDIFLKNRVFHSILKVIPIYISYKLVPYIFYNHPESYQYADKMFFIGTVVLFLQFLFRVLSSLEDLSSSENSNYRTVAVRSFVQITKILSVLIGIFGIIFIIFDIDTRSVLTVIGAITAVILLVFRDPILGFVTGLHVSTSRVMKVGDWITIPKYHLEGTITEINLITTKVENLDKIISSIPTYDLISTEVRNHEPLFAIKRRRIMRSMIFSIKSFAFLTEEKEQKLAEIPLLKEYMERKKHEIEAYNQQLIQNHEKPLSKRQLTNIGVFRKYAEMYLSLHERIDQNEILMVRQLEIKPQGLPLELYCFTKAEDWVDFEKTQADIFDHLLTIAKEFELDIVQTLTA